MGGFRFIRWLFNMHVIEPAPVSCVSRSTAVSAESGQPCHGDLTWLCNVCGVTNHCLITTISREAGPCKHCGAVMRFRSLMSVLTERLFGKMHVLSAIAETPQLIGVGMSDAGSYATYLARKFGYTNTYYHCDPLLDIMRPAPQWLGVNDFVIASDVFEHVAPPIQKAFDNLFALLKPGGVVVFSVPFNQETETREHYPGLHDYKVRQETNGDWLLENITKDGESETFRDLVFHGGPGATLEMRVFSERSLLQHFAAAGFTDLRIHGEPHVEHGIFWLQPLGLVISAVKPF